MGDKYGHMVPSFSVSIILFAALHEKYVTYIQL